MSIAESLLPEYDNETANTRKLLERIPEQHADWKPHAKSWSLGDLSAHVANVLSWTIVTLELTEFDINPVEGGGHRPPSFTTTNELLATFDENVRKGRKAIEQTSDQEFMVGWSLLNGGATVMTLPRIAVLRSFVMNHLVHHRGQLTVYLRLKDVPLPSLYGPTADEPSM